jgi:hypothetical protein
MHRFFAVPAVLILAACQGPSPIETSARGQLRSEVEQEVRDMHQLHHGDCPAAKLVAARIVEDGADATQELWTLEGCGRTFAYDVTINHEGLGGQVSVHEHETGEAR